MSQSNFISTVSITTHVKVNVKLESMRQCNESEKWTWWTKINHMETAVPLLCLHLVAFITLLHRLRHFV